MNVAERVLRQAARTPDLIAVEDEDGALSYAHLVRQARRGAGLLTREGRPGSPVAVRVPRGRDLIVAGLAAMLAGRPYLPLDPAEPARRARAFLKTAAIDTAVATDLDSPGLCTFAPAELEGAPAEATVASEAAYVVRTSGSTGIPKGVVVGHAGLLNLVDWHNRTYGVGPGLRHLQTANAGFDAAVWEIWPCLCAGATVVVAPIEVRLSAAEIVDYARARRISTLFAPTPVAEMIVELDSDDAITWRTLLTGGDVLRLRRLPRGWTIVNHYGPAEATVCTTWHPVTALPPNGRPAIGRPIDGVLVEVCDDDGVPVPPGDTGEIRIGGRGLALGYLRRPEETARLFGPLPGRPGRWYRTSDLAVYDERGDLHFRGRVSDDQVQISGVRIETGEVEAALLRHPRIRRAAVAPVGPPGSARVLGALVVAAGPGPTPAQLRQDLAADLPPPAIPTRLVPATVMPLTPNGKIDRAAVRRALEAADQAAQPEPRR
ncbi:amino acid adenylation domain-containing protein [Actinomadura fulvescens]|uniref:Amino acid adenylation domain-containing protein n=1 Tax=Actinomadura fulvescens TaxID=46160 RepID=A0ABP6CF69_9ACTN